jgi:hypothetical protein
VRAEGKRIGVSAGRRVGVCGEPSALWGPPGRRSHVEKQSYFARRRYADTPTRFPWRPSGKFFTTRYLRLPQTLRMP